MLAHSSTFPSPRVAFVTLENRQLAKRPKHKRCRFLTWMFLVVLISLLLVYILGLRQGLKVVNDVENDVAVRMWGSFLGLLEGDDETSAGADDDTLSGNERKPGENDDDDGVEETIGNDEEYRWKYKKPDRDKDFLPKRWENRQPRMRRRKFPRPKVEVMFEQPSQLKLSKPIINHWYCCEEQEHPSASRNHQLMSRCLLENVVNGTPFFDGCGNFDVYTEINGPRHFHDLADRNLLDNGTLLPQEQSLGRNARLFFPQHHQLEAIHRQYPNATLILNVRPVEAWISSVLKWETMLEFEILNEFYYQNTTRFLFEKLKPVNNPNSPFINTNIKKHLTTVFNYHSQYIRDWVAQHPSHALVEVDISHNDSGRILAESFGLEEACWGHFNENKGDQSYKQRQRSKRYVVKRNGKFEERRYNTRRNTKREQKRINEWRNNLKKEERRQKRELVLAQKIQERTKLHEKEKSTGMLW
ncbi:hypothetical protein IV203_016839 [Nitzschia inconspicua]|uniref:Uncharacterized protein n=1 Tax=Nitzschia inconspicua TaxID=303405 RepID=A0A9K3PKC7_9STRA|nr:hypothetical protein IV203_016839 [Nitzschia inconspicua]